MQKMFSKCLIAAVCVVLLAGTVAAQTQTVYNSIPKPLPGNVSSYGPEAFSFREMGDGLFLTATTGTVGQVTVIMSSWACQTGGWSTGDCVTTPGATFSQPITINLYSVNLETSPVSVGSPLATITQTFNIPFRPTSTPAQCGGDATRWYSNKDKTCYHGLAVPIAVNFSGQKIPLQANGALIVTVVFNTSTAGPSPLGTPGPYDSLNISTDTTNGTFQFIGGPVDTQGIFVNYISPTWSCNGTTYGSLVDDTGTGCWTGYHPEIQVQANTKATGHSKGNGP
jgi:hypothetical protein